MRITTKKTTIEYLSLLICILLVAVDQITKYLAVSYLKDGQPFVIWKDVFQLEYLENRGAAFGIFQNQQWFFYIGTILVIFFVIRFYLQIPVTNRFLWLRACMILLLAGAIGNLIDRVRYQYVVDFLYFKWIDFPVFNVADCYVVVACIGFLLLMVCFYQEEELSQFSFRKGKK
jgi:signal peptidase II